MMYQHQLDSIFQKESNNSNCDEQMEYQNDDIMFDQQKGNAPVNYSETQLASAERSVQQAYERYVLAQFLFKNQQDIQTYRQKAIESLIPGTLYHYHLFFLDLVKSKRDIKDFSKEEKDLFDRFNKKFGQTCQFYEVETKLQLLNKLEKVPQINEKSTKENIDGLIDVLTYLEKHFRQSDVPYIHKPSYFNQNYNGDSSQSESEDQSQSEKISKTQVFNYAKFFNRQEDLKKAQEHADTFAEVNKNKNFNNYQIQGFENEIDWSKVAPEYVYQFAEIMKHQQSPQSYQIFEMTNESFFDKICEHIKDKYQKYQQTKKPQDKFHVSSDFFDFFTVEQLDIIRNTLTKKGIDFKDKDFFKAYFSKVFSEELSAENQELLTIPEKLQNVIVLFNYAKAKNFSNGLCSTLLHEIMTLSIKCDDYKEDLFIEYLKNPMEKNHNFKQKSAIEYNQKAKDKRSTWNACLQNVQSVQSKERYQNWDRIDTENDVIPKYLNHICIKNKGKLLDKFQDYFTEQYLKQIERKVQVYQTDKGLIDLEDDFDHHEYKRIQDEVILRFKETNQEIFKVDEKVVFQLEIKNVPELTIKIFEFNTETYYKKNLQPFDSSIDLQGLEPSFLIVEREKFKNVKKNKILTETFEFEQLKGKTGLFIVEFQGNGLMSRAVVKKGSLSLIHRSTANGHMAFIIDSERRICKSEGTGVWIEKKFYECNLEKNGAIFIPYISDGPRSTKLIMIHEGFAQLGEFMINTERYELDLYYHINSESILVGQEAHILVRPSLTINGRKTNVKQLKNTKVELTILDFNNIPTKLTFNDLKFTDTEETILSFQVPLNSSNISINMKAQVQNATLKKLQDFQTATKQIVIHEHKNNRQLKELYLRKVGKNYFVYCLGRNGEPQTNGHLNITVKHKDQQNTVHEDLQLDKHGRVGLGELKDIEHVTAYSRIQDQIQETWYINQVNGDMWVIPDQINIIEGECVEIPVNYSEGQQLSRYQASLEMKRDQKLIKNMFQRIKLIKSEKGGQYQLLKLEGLENGEYTLKLKLSASQLKTIDIVVHKGQYWEGNFILKKNCLIENYTQKNAIRLETIDVKNQQQNESQISIQLTNFSEKTRVHLYSMQFVPNTSASLWSELSKFTQEKFSQTKFPFAKWRNMFDSEQVMSDEIRYVIKRKLQENQMGNVLDRPSLLVKRQFVQNTHTENERLKQGTTFAKKEYANDYDKASERVNMMHKKKMVMKESASNRSSKFCSIGGVGGSNQNDSRNIIKDYQNFLSCAPIQIFNLKPNQNGLVETKIQDLQNYSQIFVVACDDGSVCQRELSLNSLEEKEIPKRDLSQNKKVDEAGLIEQRQSIPLQKDSQVHIEDITSSKVQIIDALNKLAQILEISFLTNGIGQEQKIQTMVQDIFLKWHKFDTEKKLSSYSKYHSHELNFFIFKKDKEFFENVVLDKINTKMEKTFVDWYLLSQAVDKSFHQYYLDKVLKIILDLSELDQLNIFEQCLLIENCFKFGDEVHKNKAKQLCKVYITIQKNKDKENMKQKYYIEQQIKIFEAILNLSDLDKENKIDLQDIAKQMESDQFGDFGRHYQQESCVLDDIGGMDVFGSAMFSQQQQIQSSMNYQQQQYQPQMLRSAMMQNVMPQSQNIQSMSMNSMPMSSSLQRGIYAPQQNFGGYGASQKKDLFECEEDDDSAGSIQQFKGKKAALNSIGFQEVEKTAEYMETHYYDYPSAGPFKHRYSENQFYSAYIQHLLESFENKENQTKFITSSFIDISQKDLPILIALTELPNEKVQSHKYKSDGKRGIFITLNSNALIFKKEIKEGECQLKNDLMVIHRYASLQHGNQDEELEDFIVNHAYQCEVIMTNVSSKHKQVTLLMQIPNGSLPLMKSKYIESKTVMINPFSTIKETVQFYFPKDGKFQHYPSNISENGIVVSKASIKEFDVGKKLIVKKVQTFQHLMMMQQNDEGRKKKIIELFQNEIEKSLDPTFQFNHHQELQYYLYQDQDFAMQFLELADSLMILKSEFTQYIAHHFKKMLVDEKYKNKRDVIIRYYKNAMHEKFKQSGIISYVLNPFSNQIIDVSQNYIYDIQFKHLEYFPMVNSRVFAIGGQDIQDEKETSKNKEILNTQFRSSYYKFLHLALHQEFNQDQSELNLNAKLKLQLVYYLQLQDRIDEAINVFKTIDIKDIQKGGANDVTCQIIFDYMQAYFDFYTGDQGEESSALINKFQIARDIVKKYEKCNIQSYKNAFNKIKEQLEELDRGEASILNEQIEVTQSDEITEEQKRIALEQSKNKQPQIHEIKLDKSSGELDIDSVNIDQFTVKYYLIDTEILFSRSPFVQNQAERFSYVKPCLEIKKSTVQGQNTKISLSDELKGKNLVIEINSNDIQKFLTFYSSKMLVQCNEEFGELRVCHTVTKKPLNKVYVKVFCKNNSDADVFFRDGFTDIRGKFEYANASGKSLDDVQKFSIFVDHQEHGSLIKEVGKPKKQ